ncbi:MAG TPA: peroxiredoxin-like family protein [Candidatus Limnocylindrales bacterium]|jgi:peroxiredoxin
MPDIPRQQPDTPETDAASRDWLDHWRAGPTRRRWVELPPQVGDPAPDLELLDARTGERARLSHQWADRPALLLFWRHFGCSCGRDRAERLRREFADYAGAGATVVLIGQGERDRTLVYAAANELPDTVALLCDPAEAAYRAYGLLEGGPAEVLFDAPDEYLTCQPQVGATMAEERRALARPNVDNPWLLPGEFVVAPDGRLVTTYRFQFCEHWLDPRANVAAIRFASGELRPAF